MDVMLQRYSRINTFLILSAYLLIAITAAFFILVVIDNGANLELNVFGVTPLLLFIISGILTGLTVLLGFINMLFAVRSGYPDLGTSNP